jgi:hypothetical protein
MLVTKIWILWNYLTHKIRENIIQIMIITELEDKRIKFSIYKMITIAPLYMMFQMMKILRFKTIKNRILLFSAKTKLKKNQKYFLEKEQMVK